MAGSRPPPPTSSVSLSSSALPVLPHFRRDLIGTGGDPQLFVWSLGWWPHARAPRPRPVRHARRSGRPHGSNLAWTTSIPGLALLLAPVTLAAGAVAAYNAAAILLPALAAWTAFLLCRHLTRSFWPSLAGGYLFGFSSYLLGAGARAPSPDLRLPRFRSRPSSCCGSSRAARRSRSSSSRLGPLLALQLLFSTEVLFTLTLCLATGLVLGFARRARLAAADRASVAARSPPPTASRRCS